MTELNQYNITMKKLYRKSARWLIAVLTLLCSNVMTAQTYVSAITSGKVYRITSRENTGTALTDVGGTNLVGSQGWSDTTFETLWLVTSSGDTDGYTVKNVLTGKYMQGVNGSGTQATVSETEQVCFIPGTGTASYFNILPSADGAYSLNLYGGSTSTTIKGYGKGVNDSNTGSQWQFAEVTVDEDAFNFFNDNFYSKLNTNYGLIRIVMPSDGKVMTDTDGRTMVEEAADDPTQHWNQVWRIQTSATGGYSLQNLGTGKYLKDNCGHDNGIETSTTSLPIYVRMSPYEEETFNISVNSSNIETGWQVLQYVQGSGYVRRWTSYWSGWGDAQSNCGFEIEFIDESLITVNQLRAQMDVLASYATPADGKVVRIVNNYFTNNFIVLNDAGQLTYTDTSDSYSQYWEMNTTDGTNFTFKNVLTGMYLQKGTDPYTTALHSNGTFAVEPTTPTLSICTITDSGSNGLHGSGGNVINWTTNAEASVWYFQEATLTEADWEAIRSNPTNKAVTNLHAAEDYGLVRFVTDRADGKVLAEVDGAVKLVAPNAADKTQLWVMTLTNGQYTFRNWSTGRYIDRASGTVAALPTTTATTQKYKIVIASSSTSEKSLYNFYHPDTNANGWYYDGTSESLQIAATADKELGAAFCIEPATDVQPIVPEAGKYYRIQNVARLGFIIVNESAQLSSVTESEDYSQFWQVVPASGTNYELRNAYTGQYVQKVAEAETRYTTGIASANFSLEVKTDLPYCKEYYIVDENSEGLHGMESGNIIRYTTNAGASVWYFEEVTLTEEQRTAIESQPHNRVYAVLSVNDGLVRLIGNRNTAKSAADINGSNTSMAARDDSKVSQIWHITPNAGGYSIRNMESGQYLQGYVANFTPITLAASATTYYIKPSTTKDGQFVLSSTSDYSENTCLHDDSGNTRIVGWNLGADESQWTLDPVTNLTLHELEMRLLAKPVLAEALAANSGLVHIATDRSNGYVLADAGVSNGNALAFAAPSASDLSQLWVMTASGDGYTLQNVQTGRYVSLSADKNVDLATAETSAVCRINVAPTATADNLVFSISHAEADKVGMYYRSADGAVITNSTTVSSGAAFRITAATGITAEEVRTALLLGEGWSVPETGKYYRIYNGYWSSTQGRTDEVITEESNKLTTTTVTSDNKAEIWLLTSTDGTNFSFKNYSTGNYIQSQTTNVDQYATGSTEVTFSVGESANLPLNLQKWYNIVDTDGDGLKMENHTVVNNILSSETTQSNWRFKEVDINRFDYTTEHNTKTLDQLINDHNGIVMVRSVRNGALSKVMAPKADASGLYLETLADNLTDETNWNQVWILERTNSASPYTYTFRNLGSGEYIKEGLGLGEDKHNFYIQASTKTTGAFNIAKSNTFDGATYNSFNEQSGGIGWWWAQNDTGSDWYIEPVEGIAWDMVKEHLNIPTYTAPVSGKYYKIVSRAYGHVITAKTSSTEIQGQEYANFPSQWWKITVNGSNYTFQNAATEKYIQGDPGQGNLFNLGPNAVNFSLAQTDDHYGIYISGSTHSRGLHQSTSQSDNIVSWSYSADASRWYFEEVTLSAEEIEAKVTAFQKFMNASSMAESISDTYLAFFTDASATVLKSEYQSMTDDELREAMTASAIPSGLQNEAVKVKNNSWEAWEKEFRVADYNIFSDANDWSGYMQTMEWGVMNNPTGVVANNGEVIYVVVGTDIPAGTTLTLEARKYYDVSNGATQNVTLKKGLNALPCSNDGSHIYVRYETDFGTVTKDNKASHPNVANYPSLNIHVIGGNVHGYVDNAKHTDADWVSMQENGLFWAEQTDLLGRCSQVRLQTDFATANGDQIIRLIDMYDWYVGNELDVMGVTAVPDELKDLPNADLAYEDVYPKKVNNRLLCISKKDEGGNPYGSSYHIYVPGSGNYLYDNLKNKDGGSIWVFGHEWGHVNQGPINIAASNEASNNLYPNILANRGGYSTSRGWNVQELQRKMANERSVNASGTYESQFGVTNDNYLEICGEYSWPRTVLSWDNIGKHFTPAQMFYQLYLYYHAAGNNVLFYPRLFNEMRKDPLRQNADGNKITGWSDYLHFAMKACDAAGENLEDFFDAWGFFVPVSNYFVECYSQWYITTTQDQINDALTYMRKYDKANESIIFIDDRATVSYQADGVTPKVPFESDNVENCKTDFAGAQYSAFSNDAPSCPDGLAYTTSTNTDGNTVVTINTDVTQVTNVAGVKFYDTNGKLVYFASQKDIVIPANLKSTVDLSKTVIALTDGTTMPLYNANDAGVFEQTIHHGNGTISTRYTMGEDAAVLDAERDGKNAVAMIEDDNVPESLAATNNVAVNGVVQHLVLTDKVDFKLPADYTAKNITYKERYLYEGWNTLCLPFAITKSDLGEGAKIEVLDQVETSEDILYFVEVDGVAAGQPCLVWMPGENASWSYENSNDGGISFKGSPDIAAEGFYMNGNFKKENIGAGHYKLNSAGTAFGVTTAKGISQPFRAYVSAVNGGNVRTLRVMHRDAETTTDITVPALESLEGGVCYDLQGRKVKTPKRGEIYILGGRKVFFK